MGAIKKCSIDETPDVAYICAHGSGVEMGLSRGILKIPARLVYLFCDSCETTINWIDCLTFDSWVIEWATFGAWAALNGSVSSGAMTDFTIDYDNPDWWVELNFEGRFRRGSQHLRFLRRYNVEVFLLFNWDQDGFYAVVPASWWCYESQKVTVVAIPQVRLNWLDLQLKGNELERTMVRK